MSDVTGCRKTQVSDYTGSTVHIWYLYLKLNVSKLLKRNYQLSLEIIRKVWYYLLTLPFLSVKYFTIIKYLHLVLHVERCESKKKYAHTCTLLVDKACPTPLIVGAMEIT